MLPQEVIRHKRDGKKLTEEEIDFFVRGIVDWSISECQIAAFAMAMFLKDTDIDETVALTKAMAASGETIVWHDAALPGPGTGGYFSGGKINLIFAPLVAACGGFVPTVAMRSQNFSDGLAEKLNSIPGYATVLETAELSRIVREIGCAVVAQAGDLVTAGKRLFAVTDATATSESFSLKTAFMLSSKLATGLDSLVLNLHCSDLSCENDMEKARLSAQKIVRVSKGVRMPAGAVLSGCDRIAGRTAGNAVEVAEAVAYLNGSSKEPYLHDVTLALCSEALILSGLAAQRDEAREKLQRALDSGKAAEIFARMVTALGGAADFTEKPNAYLPAAPVVRPVYARKSGYVSEINPVEIDKIVAVLGGRRLSPFSPANPAVGLTDIVGIGEEVDADRPLAFIHAADEETFARAEEMVHNGIRTAEEKPVCKTAVYETITA